jgi:cytochrome c biogenesis protein CcmG, thiol:disulfide interchange protein DsbE
VRPVAALGALAVVVAACSGGGGDAGTTLPDLTLSSLHDGAPALDVGALRGPAVVNLWATWCGPCRQELPAFQEVSTTHPDVRFVGVDIAEDAGKARDFLAGLGITFDQYLDDRSELTDALGTAVLPVTIVVDADGKVATEHIGPMSVADLEHALADL